MRKIFFIALATFSLAACRKRENLPTNFYDCSLGFADSSQQQPKHLRYQTLLDNMRQNGVVGVSMAIFRPNDGLWLGASGKADLFNNIDMQPCHISRVGSTVKMYTATTVLKLQEEGKLNIDDKISAYLSGAAIDKIKNAETATIRQLLQHSSGIFNYIQSLNFQTASLNDLLRDWSPADLLAYAEHQSPYFAPDADVIYSNTNYILLGLLLEKIENKPLYQIFEDKLFAPLNLNFTSFAGRNPVPEGIARGYIDLYSNLQVIESTYYSGWDYHTADGGLIANPYDMSRFFRALMAGQIINTTSLNQMLSFKTPLSPDPNFFPIDYGLGIFRINTPFGIAYMHSGDAIGYYANMLYFPDDQTTITYAVNSNYGKIDEFISTQSAIQSIIEAVRN